MQYLNMVHCNVVDGAGTGSVTVGSPITDATGRKLTPAEAGAQDGTPYRWQIKQGADWEIFSGAPSSTATVIARTTVEQSCISGTVGTTKLTLTSGATLRAIASAADIPVASDDYGLVTGATTLTDDYGSVA